MHRLNFIAAALVLLLCSAAAPTYSLKDVLAKAATHSPTLKASEQLRQVAKLEHENALIPLLPSLDFSAEHGLGNDIPKTEPNPWQSRLTVTLAEKLYDNGVSFIQRDITELQKQIADLDVAEAKSTVQLAAARAFFEHSEASFLIEANAAVTATLETQLRVAERQYRSGLRTRKDYLRFRGDVKRAKMEAAQLEKQRDAAVRSLALLTGMDLHPTQIAILNPRRLKLPQPPTKTKSASETREGKIAAVTRQTDQYGVDLVRKQNWPQLSLNSQIAYGSQDYIGTGNQFIDQDHTSWSVSLSLEHNFIDFGKRSRDVAIAVARQSANTLNSEARLRELTNTLQTLVADLQLSAKNLELADELLQLEEESYGLVSTDYRQGRLGYLELAQSLQNLNSARRGYYSTAFSYLSQWANLSHYEGTLSEMDF